MKSVSDNLSLFILKSYSFCVLSALSSWVMLSSSSDSGPLKVEYMSTLTSKTLLKYFSSPYFPLVSWAFLESNG